MQKALIHHSHPLILSQTVIVIVYASSVTNVKPTTPFLASIMRHSLLQAWTRQKEANFAASIYTHRQPTADIVDR